MHYRYTGKERDEESGLYYHGARYYIPWLCRWCAVDPLESKYGGMSPYNYSFNNPVMFNDPSGMKGEKTNNDATIYDVAETAGKGFKPTHGGTLSETTQSQRPVIDGEFEISTVTETTSDGKQYFVGYYVYDKWLRGDQGGRLDKDKYADPTFQYTQPLTIEDFRKIAHAARTFYLWGKPPEATIKKIAGVESRNWKLVWSGIKQENKEAWTNPEFYINVIAGTIAGLEPEGSPRTRKLSSLKEETTVTKQAEPIVVSDKYYESLGESEIRDSNSKLVGTASNKYGNLDLYINTKESTLSGRGPEVFKALVEDAQARGEVLGINGTWNRGELGSNLRAFNKAIQSGLSPEEAAFKTFTGENAGNLGFKNVQIYRMEGPVGNYYSVSLIFRK